MPLTEMAIRKAKPTDKTQKLADGRGLSLWILPSGGKSWRWRYTINGKEKLMTLGLYPDVSLAQARELCDQARKQKAIGHDPMVERKIVKQQRRVAAENSFETIARAWHAHWSPARSARHAQNVLRRLEADLFPRLGARPIADIQPLELVGAIKDIASRGALDIAKRAYQTSGQIFAFAMTHGFAQRNPARDLSPSDFLPSRHQEHFARVDAKELPQLLIAIEAYQGSNITRLAMKLLANTFVRTGELIGARWSEFELDDRLWRIPASRMKMRTEHLVPLSDQSLQILQALQMLTGRTELLFPGERDRRKPMSNNTILAALKRMGYAGKMTGHGFRGVASTILHEKGYEHEHIELQLAHMARNKVSAAYNHARYLDQRRILMQEWSDYLEQIVRPERTHNGVLRAVA